MTPPGPPRPSTPPPPPGPPPGRLLDKHELADYLRVDVGWVVKAITARTVPITWVGRHARFDLADIKVWLASRKESPAAPVTAIDRAKSKRTQARGRAA